jgi:hypothetical protein
MVMVLTACVFILHGLMNKCSTNVPQDAGWMNTG